MSMNEVKKVREQLFGGLPLSALDTQGLKMGKVDELYVSLEGAAR